jgi:serine O-acetyltransferase
MLIKIIVKLLGGFWVIRNKYRATKVNSLKKIYAFLYTYSLQCKGSWISLSNTFNGEPCFPHGIYGVFISGGAVIGRNCVIFQHVTIGSNTLVDSKGLGAPIIGDNCYIGTGAKIIGNVKVGNNVRIGANAVVYEDVPDNCVVTCGTQRVIQKEQPLNNRFYHQSRGEWVFFENGRWSKVQERDELSLLDRFFPNN